MNEIQTIVVGLIPKGVQGYGNGYEMLRRVYSPDGLAPTIRTYGGGNLEPKVIEMENEIFDKALNTVPKDSNIRIRKLTPKECWRLMGFDDDSFNRAEQVNSNSQLYKQAGNSIVVNVLEAIFKQML